MLPASPCLPQGPSVQEDRRERSSENKARNLAVSVRDPVRIYIMHPTRGMGQTLYFCAVTPSTSVSSMAFLAQWQQEKQRRG